MIRIKLKKIKEKKKLLDVRSTLLTKVKVKEYPGETLLIE